MYEGHKLGLNIYVFQFKPPTYRLTFCQPSDSAECKIYLYDGKTVIYSFQSPLDLLNQQLVTQQFERITSKNHHGDLISTLPKKSAAQKSRPAGPIRAADTNRTTRINFSLCQQNATRLKALQREDLSARIL